MLITTATTGENKDFPMLAVVEGRTIGLRIKVLEIQRGRVRLGVHLLEDNRVVMAFRGSVRRKP